MKYLLILILILSFMCCTPPNKVLTNFKSDGCSMFPDRSPNGEKDWAECCFEHDILYWQGGSKRDRFVADYLFRECVLERTADPHQAEIMFRAVRIGGSPYFPTWYRWGYGWNYLREYEPLSEEEQNKVDEKMKIYYQNQDDSKKQAESIWIKSD